MYIEKYYPPFSGQRTKLPLFTSDVYQKFNIVNIAKRQLAAFTLSDRMSNCVYIHNDLCANKFVFKLFDFLRKILADSATISRTNRIRSKHVRGSRKQYTCAHDRQAFKK